MSKSKFNEHQITDCRIKEANIEKMYKDLLDICNQQLHNLKPKSATTKLDKDDMDMVLKLIPALAKVRKDQVELDKLKASEATLEDVKNAVKKKFTRNEVLGWTNEEDGWKK